MPAYGTLSKHMMFSSCGLLLLLYYCCTICVVSSVISPTIELIRFDVVQALERPRCIERFMQREVSGDEDWCKLDVNRERVGRKLNVGLFLYSPHYRTPHRMTGAGIPTKSNPLSPSDSFSLSLSDFELPTSFHFLCKKVV